VRVLFSTGALWGAPLAWSVRLARAAGCDGVELVIDPSVLLAGQRRVARLSDRLGMPIVALHPSIFGFHGMNRPPSAFEQLGEWSRELGTGLVVLHPPRMVNLAANTCRFDAGLAALRKAADPGLRIALENVPLFVPEEEQHPFTRPTRLAEFAHERGLSLTLDTTHLASANLDLLREYDAVAGLVSHVHLSDFRMPARWLDRPKLDTYMKHHQLPGVGALPLRAFVQRLRATGYSGAITLELSPVALQFWRPWSMAGLLRRSVGDVRRAWHVGDLAGVPVHEMAQSPVGAG
jgi:sugar phosphate isomerase/epimerase